MGEIRITRKLLEDYQKYKREIPLLENELEELLMTEKGLGSSVILDYRDGFPRPRSVVGFDWGLYDRRREELRKKKAAVEAVRTWINAIEDGQTRCVFRMCYMEGLTWAKIAQSTGYGGNADYPRRYIRDKYLEKYQIK